MSALPLLVRYGFFGGHLIGTGKNEPLRLNRSINFIELFW